MALPYAYARLSNVERRSAVTVLQGVNTKIAGVGKQRKALNARNIQKETRVVVAVVACCARSTQLDSISQADGPRSSPVGISRSWKRKRTKREKKQN
jgi:hypothetical protein